MKLGKNKKNNSIKYLVDDKTKLKITDPHKISNKMNDYFCNIGKELADKIEQQPGNLITLPPINSKTIYLHPTHKYEI